MHQDFGLVSNRASKTNWQKNRNRGGNLKDRVRFLCKYDCCWRFPNMKIWQNYDKRKARWQNPIRIKLCTKSGKRLGGLIRRTKISSRWVGSLFMWLQWRWSWWKSSWWIWFSKFETNPDFNLEDLEKKQKMHLLPIAVTNVPIWVNKCDNLALKACQLK